MEILQLSNKNTGDCIARAREVLRAGGVVLYPTDTLYGLGVDALSNEAVAKLYEIKGREEGKPIHAIVADIEMAERYGEVGDVARKLARELPRGKLTLIVPKKISFDSGICRDISTFGFRIPDNIFCMALSRVFDGPITATSANRSGEKPERTVEKILKQLGGSASGIDLVVDAGELPPREPSTVVDITNVSPLIVREGGISAPEVWNVVRDES